MLLVDISRLIENLHLQTPTGIDRVEMAYAQHFLQHADRDDLQFVATWPAFSGLLDVDYVKPLIEDAASRWQSSPRDLDNDRSLNALRQALNGAADTAADAPLRVGASDQEKGVRDHVRIVSTLLRSAMRPLSGRTLSRIRERGAWYIHVSQFRLNRPMRFMWMPKTNVRGLFMLHDLIPIMHPEYCRPGEARRHTDRVDTMVERASLIVANSDFTRQSLRAHVGGRSLPRCEVVPLGISPPFAAFTGIAPIRTDIPYFVVIGTIEPRKNLEFLLTLWRRWTGEGQSPRARLVIVGRRGWEIESVSNLLDRSVGLAPTVIEARSLSDAGMIALLRGAAALLAPSWVEGFGLPIAEALALGVPVLASDVAAHREVGGAFAEYLAPIDGRGWRNALDDYATPDSERRQSRVAALKGYRPSTWSDHMVRVEALMR
jgi:glycosyltransferase involved in cell wall biosynthesis